MSRSFLNKRRYACDLLVADEAHHAVAGGWVQQIDRWHPKFVLGLTATPWRGSVHKGGTEELYTRFTLGKSRLDEIYREAPSSYKLGYCLPTSWFYGPEADPPDVLARPTFDCVPVQYRNGEAVTVVGTRRNYYNDPKIDPADEDGTIATRTQRLDFLQDPKRNIVDARHGDSRRVLRALEGIDADACATAVAALERGEVSLIFCRNIKHANFIHGALRGAKRANLARAGFESPGLGDDQLVLIHSGDPQLRVHYSERLWELKSARAHGCIVVSVDMMSEGLDVPRIENVIVPRWTTSERWLWQAIGRGLRGKAIRGGSDKATIRTYDLRFALSSGKSRDADIVRADRASPLGDSFRGYAEFRQPEAVRIR